MLDHPTTATPLAGRRVLVTGASAGIGAATARAIVGAGGRVALLARSRDRLDALVRSLEAEAPDPGPAADRDRPFRGDEVAAAEQPSGPVAVAVAADVVDPEAVRAAVDRAAEALAGLDGVVNAAGVARPGPVATTSPADWQAMLDVNVRGLLHVTQAALPHLVRAGTSDVVNVSSMSGRRVGSPAMGVYAASKAAVHALSEGLRREVAEEGVRVSIIAPGFVRTGIFAGQDTEAARTLGARGEEVGLPPEQVADRIVEVLAAPPGVVHLEVAIASIDQS
jgi:NADP-dependent 3-hydroxy acid dehydrogenase YdfG